MIRTCYKCLNEFEEGPNGFGNKYMCPTCYKDFEAKYPEWLKFSTTTILGDLKYAPELVDFLKLPEN